MKLVNTVTGEKYPFTLEAVGACDVETLAFALSEIKKHNLPVTRIVTIVGLDELMTKGWIEPMLQMAQDAGIRLIVPPISPLEGYDNGLKQPRWNATALEGAWLGTSWNDETIQKCVEVVDEFVRTHNGEFSLKDCFGVLVTDTGLLSELPDCVFTKVSVLCGTSNFSKAQYLSAIGASSINLVPMRPDQVKEIFEYIHNEGSIFTDVSLLDVYMDPPRSICPPWYELDTIIALAVEYIKAGASVIKAEGTEIVGQLLDHDYLIKIAISRQIMVFLEVLEVCNTSPYEVVDE
jgi:hypothetical protein